MLRKLFISHLLRQFFGTDSRRYGMEPIRRMLDFLIDRSLITSRTIRHYVVLREFESMVSGGGFKNKTQAIKSLAERLNVHENTIWNILKDHQRTYQPHQDTGLEQPRYPPEV